MVARTQVQVDFDLFRFEVQGLAENLRVIRFSGHEAMSRLFEFKIELASEDPAIDFAEVVGKPALLSVRGDGMPRSFNGIVCAFEQIDELPRYALYQATLVPVFWRLGLRHDCRIFQGLTTEEIIRKVFSTAEIPAQQYRFNLVGNYEPRDYCVQYRESDWAFVSRLLEEDGIFHYFEHEEDKHVLVMGSMPASRCREETCCPSCG
jgi:type VI secretion system secreted protein VgrG